MRPLQASGPTNGEGKVLQGHREGIGPLRGVSERFISGEQPQASSEDSLPLTLTSEMCAKLSQYSPALLWPCLGIECGQ
jgi:hypothetical protein